MQLDATPTPTGAAQLDNDTVLSVRALKKVYKTAGGKQGHRPAAAQERTK